MQTWNMHSLIRRRTSLMNKVDCLTMLALVNYACLQESIKQVELDIINLLAQRMEIIKKAHFLQIVKISKSPCKQHKAKTGLKRW